jgi:30S ribosomal protein S31
MGKGDRKTAKGKRYNSSYGNSRTQVTKKAAGDYAAPVAKKVASRTGTTSTAAKAPAKKVVAKKTVAKD